MGEAVAAACGTAVVGAALACVAGVGAGVVAVDDVGPVAGGEPQTQHDAVGCFVVVGSCHHSTSS